MSNVDWARMTRLASVAAGRIAQQWGVVESDDLRQDLIEHVAKKPEYFNGTDAELVSLFKRMAVRIAGEERDYQNMFAARYWYTPHEVRKALQSIAEGYGSNDLRVLKDNLDQCTINDSKVIARVDTMRCLKKLPPRLRQLVFNKFVLGEETQNSTDYRAAYRALEDLTRLMNRDNAIKSLDMAKGGHR